MNRYIAIFFLCALCFMTACGNKYTGNEPPKHIKGVLDLRQWDFEKDGPVQLDGEWEFYWKKLHPPNFWNQAEPPANPAYIQVPKSWNGFKTDDEELSGEGYATYRLTLLLPPSKKMLGIRVKEMGTAYQIWLNNDLVLQNGVVGKSKKEMIPDGRHQFKSFHSIEKIQITAQVSNYYKQLGGQYFPIALGSEQQIKHKIAHSLVYEMFLFGAIFMMALYHLGLFWIRRKEKSALYFGLTCLAIAMRILFTGENIVYTIYPDFDWELSKKLEYMSILAVCLFLVSFCSLQFKKEFSPTVLKLFVFFGAMLAISNIFFQATVYTQVLIFYQLFGLIVTLYSFYIIIVAFFHKRDGAAAFLFGGGFFLITGINDILHNNELIQTLYLLPLGWFILIFSQAFSLSSKFSHAFFQIEKMSERLLSLDKLKDEFLANTSHELRTPLNGIIGIAESLMEGASGKLPKLTRQNLSLIVNSGKRLANLVNDILDFSKLRDQSIHLHLKPVGIKQIGEVVIMLTRPMIVGKELIIENKIPDNLPLALGDENRIQQILFNLIGNAVKFTEQGSVTLNAEVKDKIIEISVSDTGSGIAKDKHKDIFTSFEQADGSIERQFGGTGLGLSITKSLVELQGGSIWISSEQSGGSVFTFTLPVADIQKEDGKDQVMVSASATTDLFVDKPDTNHQQDDLKTTTENHLYLPDTMNHSNQKGITVLAVDDELINLQVIINHLELAGITVETANSGGDALKKLETGRVDIILLDIMMPRMNGYETAKKIRQTYAKETLPIIFLTAKNQENDLVSGFSSGGNDYITKPIGKNELISRITFHVELAQSRGDLEHVKWQIDQLLETTKAMSKAKTKVMASSIAMVNLLSMLEELNIIKVDLFLPQKSDTTFTGYTLLAEGDAIENPFPYEVLSNKSNELKQINKIMSSNSNQTFIIPVISEKRKQAVLEIQLNEKIPIFDERAMNLINGVALSLSLYLDNLEAEEHFRLSNLGSMAAAIVHDLKNPIGVIMGYAQMAEDEEISTSTRNEYLQTIHQEAMRISEMAHEVLTFSKGDIELNIGKIKAKSFYEDLVKMLQALFVEHGISLEHELRYDGILKLDINRIRRVILNLATNAMDAMAQNAFGNNRFRLEIKNNTDGLLILAIDNGPGIPAQIRATLFEPFITHGKSHGTGLGMAIVKKIISEHGGTISFETKSNQGTTFTIFIPMNFKELAKDQSSQGQFDESIKVQDILISDEKKKQIRILIADDNILNQKLISTYLKKSGYSGDAVSNGKEALEALKNTDYDIVLMDLTMPEMDGFEATRQIRSPKSQVLNKDVPIIAITAHTQEEDIQDCLNAGMNNCVTKPIKCDILIESIERHITFDSGSQ